MALQLEEKFHESWHPVMHLLYEEPLKTLNERILSRISYQPSLENIFNVFSMPVEDIKVVILGQDPYPTAGDAVGYAFAVPKDIRIPTSLNIIFKELQREYADNNILVDDTFMLKPTEWKTLKHWVKEGVFLLNTALTVETGKAGSHLEYWKKFTGNVVNYIAHKNKDAIFILWGRKAQAFKPWMITKETTILEAPHPAAEAYSGGKAGFYGCGHFKKVNEILASKNLTTIQW